MINKIGHNNKTKTHINILRHLSLQINTLNMSQTLKVCTVNKKRDILDQKIKVKKSVFKFLFPQLMSKRPLITVVYPQSIVLRIEISYKYFRKKTVENLTCPLGNQPSTSGCQELVVPGIRTPGLSSPEDISEMFH